MASINQVAIELQVRGEREATQALKRYSSASDKLTRSVLDAAAKVENTSNAWDRANKLFEKGVLNTKGLQAAQTQLARELAVVNGYVKTNGALNTQKALAELKAVEATKQAAAAEARANAERQRAQQSYQQLKAAIDPTYAAQMRLKKAHDTVREALRQGIITRDQAADSLRQYRAQAQMGSVGVRGFGDANHIASRQTNAFGMAMQQGGYQVGDFIVQVQSGTNAFVAFGQQATQLVGVLPMLASQFGMNVTRLIAISSVLGVVIPIVTALGAAFMRTRGEAKSFSDELDNLETVVSDLSDIQDILSMSTEELGEKYGEAAVSVREYARVEAQLQASLARSDVEDSISSLKDLTQTYFTLTDAGRNYRNALNRIESDFEVTASQARVLESAFTDIAQAQTFDQQRAAVDDLLSGLERMGVSLNNLPEPVAQMLLNFFKANRQIEEAEAIIQALEGSVEDVNQEFSNVNDTVNNVTSSVDAMLASINAATRSTGQLSTEWVGVFQNAFAAAQAMAMGEGDILLGGVQKTNYRGGRGTVNPTFEGTQRENPLAQLAYNFRGDLLGLPTPGGGTSGGGGGGGGGPDPVEEFNRAKKAVDQLRASYDEQYAASLKVSEAQETINKALEMGVISGSEATSIMEQYEASLRDVEDPMMKIAQTARDELGDALMSIVDGTASAEDAFKNMARAILKQAFDLLVIKPLMDSLFGSSGGSGGLFSSEQANGGAWNKGVQMFADGGVVSAPTAFRHSGGLGVMGEAGPEAIMPLKRGKGGKLGVVAEGGQGDVVVENHFHIAANGDDSVKRIIQQEAPKIANYTSQQIMEQRRRGGALKQTFG